MLFQKHGTNRSSYFRINTLSQALMIKFEQSVNFKSPKLESIHSIQVAYLNLSLRVRHLLYLLGISNTKVFLKYKIWLFQIKRIKRNKIRFVVKIPHKLCVKFSNFADFTFY